VRALLFLVIVGLCSCKPSPAPAPVLATTSDAVYGELVEAGCLAPSPDGVDAVAEEGAKAQPPGWIVCMFQGGRVGDCEAPCTR
jgi:hypothetical protein